MIERTPDRPASSPRMESRFLIPRRLVRWSLGGSSAFALMIAFCLFLVPQSYTARLSLSLAAATGGTNSLLASVSGLGTSPATKYIGVIRSRGFAEQVVQRTGLHRLLGQGSSEEK